MRKVRSLPRCFLFAAACCFAVAGCIDPSLLHHNGGVPAAADAEKWYHDGEFDRAGQAFMDIADAERNYSDHYRLRAAEAYREAGNLKAVAWALEDIKSSRLDPGEQTRLDLLEAEVALSRHDAARALTLLTISDAQLPQPLRQRTLELRARAQAAAGDILGSANTRVALNTLLQGNDRSQNEAQIIATLTKLDAGVLKQQGASLLPNDALRPFIDQALRKSGQELSQPIANPNQQVGVLAAGSNTPNGEGYRPARIIALLLPVGGQLRGVAQPIRDGFFAAFFSDTHMPRPEVRVYDSGNSDTEAVTAYQRAVSEGADRVVGPLRRDAVSAVFGQASLAVPVLALNQPEHGEPAPAGSAAFGLTPDTEAAQAAQHMLERGITRAAIITASNDWAERAASAFRAQFESQHGAIVGESRVRDADINFSTSIHEALSATPSTENGGETGIFISMLPQQARLLLPQLKVAGHTNQVFATSHIFNGTLNAGMDHDLDGVEFCDAPWLFDAVLGLPRRGDIAGSLDSARGTPRLFAMGLDAYALVPYLDWLTQHPDSYLPGATGQLTTDRSGRVQRVLIWARFQDGIAQPINGSLQMSAVPVQ